MDRDDNISGDYKTKDTNQNVREQLKETQNIQPKVGKQVKQGKEEKDAESEDQQQQNVGEMEDHVLL